MRCAARSRVVHGSSNVGASGPSSSNRSASSFRSMASKSGSSAMSPECSEGCDREALSRLLYSRRTNATSTTISEVSDSGNPDDATLLAQLDVSDGRADAWSQLLAVSDEFAALRDDEGGRFPLGARQNRPGWRHHDGLSDLRRACRGRMQCFGEGGCSH